MISKRCHVVCVDDDRDMCDLMEKWLEDARYDYTVDAAINSEEALELVGRCDADLYVIDSSVQGLDTLTLLQTIRKKDKITPILVVSGRPLKIDRDEAYAAGADAYITKPAGNEDFVNTVEKLLLQR